MVFDLEKTFNFYIFASNYQSVVLKVKELEKYFCIEGALYKINKANYKKLCQKWSDKHRGEVIEGSYDPWEQDGDVMRRGIDADCLNWIIENSTLRIERVDVLNY